MLKAEVVNRKNLAFQSIQSCWESFDFVKDDIVYMLIEYYQHLSLWGLDLGFK